MAALDIQKTFTETFGAGGDIGCFFAPGRINLIGDHTDYCGGHVFSCAISLGSYGAIRRRSDRQILLASKALGTDGIIEASLDSLEKTRMPSWLLLPFNIIRSFIAKGCTFDSGFEIVIETDLPTDSGLSFTASLDILTAIMLRDTFGFSDMDNLGLALLAAYSEETFGRTMCSLTDLIACALSKENSAIYIDSKKVHCEYVPLSLKDNQIILTGSQIRHGNIRDILSQRRRECEKALKKFQSVLHITALCDMNMDQFVSCKDVLMDDTLTKRARHIISENQRTIRANSVLKAGSIASFGRLLNDSHRSLKEDYEVTCPEIDLLVDLAMKIPGVLGSRMTGKGFGGYTLTLLKTDAAEEFRSNIALNYSRLSWLDAEFYVLKPGRGAARIN